MSGTFELIVLASAIFFFAATVHGSIGFGFPMISTPLLALFTDVQTAILLTLIPNFLVNIVSITAEGNFFGAVRKYWLFASLVMLANGLGALLLVVFNAEVFKLLLALAIFLYLLGDSIKLDFSWIRGFPRASLVVFSVAAGLLGGLTNVMGPVLIIYFLELKRPKSDFIQATNLCFFLGKLSQLVVFTIAGKMTLTIAGSSTLLLAVVALALYLGSKIKKRIDNQLYTRLLRILLIVLAVMLVAQVMI